MITYRSRRLCAGLTALCLTMAATASARAATTAPAGQSTQGGYVVTPPQLGSARLQFRVAAVRCGPSSTRKLEVGMFGHTRYHGAISPWSATVRSWCQNGTARYRAAVDGSTSDTMNFHPGDLVRIRIDAGGGPMSYEFDDVTSGAGFGGSSASGPGGTPVPVPTVVLGARRTGSAARADLSLTHCAVNGNAISAWRHHRQRQLIGTTVAVNPGALTNHGSAFTLTVR